MKPIVHIKRSKILHYVLLHKISPPPVIIKYYLPNLKIYYSQTDPDGV